MLYRSYNKYKTKFFEWIFNELKKNYYIERGIWTPIKETNPEVLWKLEPKLTKEQWEEAYKEWVASWKETETIWRYYNFDRWYKKFNWDAQSLDYSINWVHKKVDLTTYEWYSQYYDDWEIPMKYVEWEKADIDVTEALQWATESEMAYFNDTICKYIDTLKDWYYIDKDWDRVTSDEALEKVADAFMTIINDAWTASHQNFRFMSVWWTPFWAEEVAGADAKWLFDFAKKLPSKKAKNVSKKFLKRYNEKPIGNKKPNSAEDLILWLTKWLLDTKEIKVNASDEQVLDRIAEQLISRWWNLSNYWEEIQQLLYNINATLASLKEAKRKKNWIVDWLTDEQADEIIEWFWLEFVDRWNKKIANELWIDKNIKYDKADEESLKTLEFIKTISRDEKRWNEYEGVTRVSEKAEREQEEMFDKEMLADNSNWEVWEVDNPEFWTFDKERWEAAEIWYEDSDNFWYWWATQSIKNSVENLVDSLILKDADNYKIIRDSNSFQIVEDWIDDSSKELTVNMWIVYNWLEDSTKFDEHAEEWLKKWISKKEAREAWEEVEESEMWIKDWYNVFWKLTSYANWNFVNWNAVKTMNMYWVNSILWKTIWWEKVSYVQVVLKDGSNILFSNKWKSKIRRLMWDNTCDDWKTLVRFNTWGDTLSFIRSLYQSLLWKNWWVEVKMLNNKWEQLSFANVNTEDVWRSFMWDEISKYIWLWEINKTNLSDVNSSVLYNTAWVKWWGNKPVSYNDISKINETLWWDTVSLNNESMMQMLYTSLDNRLEGISVAGFLARRWKLEEIPKEYLEKEELIRKIRDELRYKMEEAWYKVDVNSESLIKKISTLEINAMPVLYNADWTPFKRWVSKTTRWYEFNSKWRVKIIKEYPNWIIKYDYDTFYKEEKIVNWKKEVVYNKSYYVKVDENWNEIPNTREYLENKYRVVWVKPRIDVYDTTDVIADQQNVVDKWWYKQDNIPDWRLVKSYYYNWNRKGWYIPIDENTNIDVEMFWENVDHKVLEEQMWETLWMQQKVNKENWNMIIVLENDEWQQIEAMLQQVDDVYTSENTTYRAYYLYFNADSELGLWLADSWKAHDFYEKFRWEWHFDIINNTDWSLVKLPPKEEKERIKQVLSNLDSAQKIEDKKTIEDLKIDINRAYKERKYDEKHIWSDWNPSDIDDYLNRLKISNAPKNDKASIKNEILSKKVKNISVSKLKWTKLHKVDMHTLWGKTKSWYILDWDIVNINKWWSNDILFNKSNRENERWLTNEFNKLNNDIKLKKDTLKDLSSLLQIWEDWFLKDWQWIKWIWLQSNKYIDPLKLVQDSSFVNWDALLMYDYRMPLVYNRWAKRAEELWLLDKEWMEDLAEKWHWWWKDNRKVWYYTYENWQKKWVWWELMDYDAYQNYVIEEAKARELINRNLEETQKLEEIKLQQQEDKASMADLIEEEVRTNPSNTKTIEDMILEDESVSEEYKKIIRDEYDLKREWKIVKDISNINVAREVYSSSSSMSEIFSFTNMDVLGWNNTLSQLRWANADFRRRFGDRLTEVWSKWNRAFGNLSKDEQKTLVAWINSKVTQLAKDWTTITNKIFADPVNEAQELINELAKIFSDAWWNNIYILNKIHDENSLDNLIYKTFNTYQNVSMWMFSQLKNTDDVREFVFNAAKSMWTKDKRAFNLAKDWVWDPLWTWPFITFLANVRSAYRFAKYSLLSPVSWTLMYLNSAVMSEPLLWAKKRWLWLYYWDNNFKKLVQEEWVTEWLERDSDLIFQWANWMQMNWIATDKAINELAWIIWAPFGERIKKKIQAAALGWIHTVYDMQRSWAVREYAFAQALKQNRVETKEAIADLLQKVHSWEINNTEYATRWRKIMADTEENYARFFSNANTTAMSRHRWSRAFGFNFLQWYVINRADEMTQWIKKFYNFVKERWAKNLTWDDVTYHLAHDNIELKSFLNNIILTTKLWYYLDRVDDYDWSPAKNMLWYFVDANDYLSSLDTLWFIRLFKTIPNWIWDYLEYSDYAKQEPTVSWAAWTVAYELTAEVCSQFFREGKFLNAMMQTLIAWMKTWDLDFAATVAWVEWEKMSNGLWRFGLVDWLEKYWLEDFSEPSDIIWSVLFSTNKTTTSGKIQDKMWALSNVDKVINDPWYAAVTAVWYLPLIWEILKASTDNWGFNFTEAKYREMMNMVENDEWLKELYRGKLNTEPYTDEAITRIWADFTSFNYPAKYEKTPGKHAVWSYIEWKDTTLNSMKEDVFVQNICEKMWITVEELHNMIASDSSKTTGKLKVMAAAEAAEPGSGKIILSYMMANRLYELEKQVTWEKYPSSNDIWDEMMNQLKRIVLEEMWEWMFTADKVSWYKTIREYISIKNPSVFDTLYKNETLNSYVWSIGFLDSLMYDAAQKWDVDAKYIKNAWSVLTKYMKDTDARTSAVEYLFSQADNLSIPSSARHMVMEWILAGNIDFYNTLKNSPVLSSIYADTLRDFEERLWWTLDEVDIVDDSYRTQNKKKTYTPYTSQYWDNNGKLEDDLTNKANRYFPKSSPSWTYSWHRIPYSYTSGSVRPTDTLEWLLKYYEGLIKTYSDRLVKSTGKKYPAQGTENITFKTGSYNRWSIKWQQLSFPKHKSKQYRTNVISNLPGSHW